MALATLFSTASMRALGFTSYLFKRSSEILLAPNDVPIAYPWDEDLGWGAKYAAPTSGFSCRWARWSPNGQYVGANGQSTNTAMLYPFTPGVGFGTRFTNPANVNLGGYQGGVALLNSDVLYAGVASPYIEAYRFTSGGFGTKYSNPATLPSGSCYGPDFNSAGTRVAMSQSSSPGQNLYVFTSGTGFGTRNSNPATLPPITGKARWNAAGTVIAYGGRSSTCSVAAYPYTTVYGTKYANPASPPTNTGSTWTPVAFNPAGTAFACGSDGTPYIHAYAFSAGFGTKYSDPAVLPTYEVRGISFHPNGNAITAGQWNGSGTYVYAFSAASGFGTKYADPPEALYTIDGYSAEFSPVV